MGSQMWAEVGTLNVVTINDVEAHAMGRYPNSNAQRIFANRYYVGNTQLTDNELPASLTDRS